MGRKALDKTRKKNIDKAVKWMDILFPFFQENGLQGLTMDELCKVLKISKATLYEYFPTKDALFEFGIRWKLEQMKDFAQYLSNDEQPFIDRHHQSMSYIIQHVENISLTYLVDLKNLYPSIWAIIEEFLEYATVVLEKFYKDGMEAGSFKEMNPSILVMSDRMLFRMLADPAFLAKSGLSLHGAFEEYMTLKFYGLLQKQE